MNRSTVEITVYGLCKTYPPIPRGLGLSQLLRRSKGTGTLALDHVSFQIHGGEWFGVLGPNGAGKTTFCDILLDITHPTQGSIRINEIDVNKQHSKLKGMLCSIDYWSLDPRLRVRTFLEKSGAEWMLPRRQTRKRIEYLAELFEMKAKLDDWVVRLSGGMKKKINLMAALMSGAPALVLDEPTVGLDVFSRQSLYAQLKEYQKDFGATIAWTTHNLDEAEQVCDRIAVLNAKLLALATPQDLVQAMKKANLEQAFIEMIQKDRDQTKQGESQRGDNR